MGSNRRLDFDLNVALSPEENWNGNGTQSVVAGGKSGVVSAGAVAVDPDGRNRRWEALLDVAEMARREYEESNQRKSVSRTARRKQEPTRRRKVEENEEEEEEEDDGEFVVVRSSRGRTVTMPNKYNDSVLEPVAEFNRLAGKPAAAKRNSRLSRSAAS